MQAHLVQKGRPQLRIAEQIGLTLELVMGRPQVGAAAAHKKTGEVERHRVVGDLAAGKAALGELQACRGLVVAPKQLRSRGASA
jgi:hypothetical protein